MGLSENVARKPKISRRSPLDGSLDHSDLFNARQHVPNFQRWNLPNFRCGSKRQSFLDPQLSSWNSRIVGFSMPF
eukprot:s2020_g2.t1